MPTSNIEHSPLLVSSKAEFIALLSENIIGQSVKDVNVSGPFRKVVCFETSVLRVQNDPSIGTEELNHLEMIAAIVHQLTRNLTDEEVRSDPLFASYFVDHTAGIYPTAASGFPWTAASIQSTGDVIADLSEDMAAEQKARKTYDNILRLCDDPDVNNVIRFLREREIVHFQRFGECMRLCKERMDAKNVYLYNPAFDKRAMPTPRHSNS